MLYVCLITVVMWCSFVMMLRTLESMTRAEKENKHPLIFVATSLTSPLSLGLATPFFAPLFSENISNKIALYSQWFGFSCSITLLVFYGWDFLRNRGVTSCISSLSCAMLVFIFANSLSFISDENTGVLNFSYLDTVTPISDVQCERGILLVKLPVKNNKDKAVWRCPENIIMLGGTSVPFIPWPSYSTGSSQELTIALNAVLANAKKINITDN